MKTTFKTLIRNGEYIGIHPSGFITVDEPEFQGFNSIDELRNSVIRHSNVPQNFNFLGLELVEVELTIKTKSDE